MNSFLDRVFWGNTVLQYLYVLAGLFVAWIVLQIVRSVVLGFIRKLASKTVTSYDDAFISATEKFILPYVYLVANYVVIKQLNFSTKGQRIIEVAFTLVSVYYLVRAFNHLLQYSVHLYLRKREETETRIKQFDGMLLVVKAFVWVIGLLFFLDNIGYSVTTIVAGLGIGGIAIALAAQNILSDLFSYFVIFLDKPFEIGDFIVVGDKSGSVEEIGFKTSRVRSLGGEQLVIPNAELVKSTINNFKRLEKRRIAFSIRVVYDTPPQLLQEVPGILKSAVEKREKTLLDRSHLASLSDYYVNFEVVYFVLSDDYNLYMNIQQSILLDIITTFKEKGIEFALPTQVNINSKNLPETKQTDETNVDNNAVSGK